MRRSGFAAILCLAAVLALPAGCKTVEGRQEYTVDDMLAASVAGLQDLRFFPMRGADVQLALGWIGEGAKPPEPAGRRFDVLALSSGGPDGAFGSGALKGLAAAGEREEYEVVTGVSTGALMAPLVFAGAPYDPLLERMYTGGEMGKLLGKPNYLAALSGPALFADAKIGPHLRRVYDEGLISRVAAEHARGRRLLVATANLDANQLVIWNMGRIAQLGPQGRQLFREVLQAAIAIPGALAPVEFVSDSGGRQVRELHGDAGVMAYFYAGPDLIPQQWRQKHKPKRMQAGIDLILHNQLEAPPRPVEATTMKLAGASISNLTRSNMRLMLDQAIEATADAGVEFRYAYLPTEWRTVSSLEFDDAYMRQTFDLGYRLATEGRLWRSGPR